jgi:hypothetical protein
MLTLIFGVSLELIDIVYRTVLAHSRYLLCIIQGIHR